MAVLLLGLILFLGVHSVRIVADSWRSSVIDERGEKVWKGVYSALSIVGLVLIVWGYGLSRLNPVLIWTPPLWAPHLVWLLTAVAFVLFAASNGPVGHIKATVKHPMILGVGLWAFGHLIANGTLADLLLFGSFLVWAVTDLWSSLRRTEPAPTEVTVRADIIAIVGGLVVWFLFFVWLHRWLIGVSPGY